jgi:hypothetical protein
MMRISKSKFMAGVQCLKRLYLQVHEPELATQPESANEAIIEQGREVGMLARELFPGGIEVDSSGGLGQAIRATKELVANPEVPAIFEGAFEHQGVIVKTDILQRRKENAECRTCNPHSRFSFDHSSVFSLCPRLPISPRGRIAPIRLRASSFIIAINPSQTTTSATCHGSMQAQRSSLRKWVSSPSTTYLLILS